MSAEQIKMNGAELKRVKERAGIEEADIQKRLNCSPGSYYNYIRKPTEPIPEKVEAAIDKDSELARIKNEVINGTNQLEVVTTAMKQYGDLAGSMQKMLEVVTVLLTKQDSKYDDLKKNNDAVIRSNDVLMEFLSIAKKEGEFAYHKKTA